MSGGVRTDWWSLDAGEKGKLHRTTHDTHTHMHINPHYFWSSAGSEGIDLESRLRLYRVWRWWRRMSEVFQMLNSFRLDFFSQPLRVSGGRSVQVYEPSCPHPHPPPHILPSVCLQRCGSEENRPSPNTIHLLSALARSCVHSRKTIHNVFCVLMSVFYLWLKLWSGAGMRPGCCLALCLGVRERGCIVTLKEEMNEVDEGPACHGDWAEEWECLPLM